MILKNLSFAALVAVRQTASSLSSSSSLSHDSHIDEPMSKTAFAGFFSKKQQCIERCETRECKNRCLDRCQNNANKYAIGKEQWCELFGDNEAGTLDQPFVEDSKCGDRPPPYWLFWNELEDEDRQAAESLGYYAETWNTGKHPSVIWSDWDDLSGEQRQWFCALGIPKGLYNGHYDDTEWSALPNDVRWAATTLGYTLSSWNLCQGGVCRKEEDKWYNKLSENEQRAANVLGYDCWLWNHYDDYYDPCYSNLGSYDGVSMKRYGTGCSEYYACWLDHGYDDCDKCAEDASLPGCILDHCLDGCVDEELFSFACRAECDDQCYCNSSKNLASRWSKRCYNALQLCCSSGNREKVDACLNNQGEKDFAQCCRLPDTWRGCSSSEHSPATNSKFFECDWFDLQPTSIPAPAPSYDSTIVPEVDARSTSCIQCDDNASTWMVGNSLSCKKAMENVFWRNGRCNNTNSTHYGHWKREKICRKSCYDANVGYDGDVCCNSTNISSCVSCDDKATPWMDEHGLTCQETILNTPFWQKYRCGNSGGFYYNYWASAKFCQKSCFDVGVGYDGDNCCEV